MADSDERKEIAVLLRRMAGYQRVQRLACLDGNRITFDAASRPLDTATEKLLDRGYAPLKRWWPGNDRSR